MVVVSAVLVLLGCARPPGGEAHAPGAPGLSGRTFTSVDVEARTLVPGTRIEVAFQDDGRLTARAGCNTLGGRVRTDGGRMVVEDLGSTAMGCDPARLGQDQWLAGLLASGPSWQMSGGTLVLRAGDTTIRLLDDATVRPVTGLVGTRWIVDTVLRGDVASSVPAGERAFVAITAGGRLTGSTGCNSFGATVTGTSTAALGNISIGTLAATARGCSPDNAVLDRAMLDTLHGTVGYSVRGGRLTLHGSDGSGLVLHG